VTPVYGETSSSGGAPVSGVTDSDVTPVSSVVVASGVTPVSGETSSDVAPDPSVIASGVAPFAPITNIDDSTR
jgi:hypothetical protein